MRVLFDDFNEENLHSKSFPWGKVCMEFAFNFSLSFSLSLSMNLSMVMGQLGFYKKEFLYGDLFS